MKYLIFFSLIFFFQCSPSVHNRSVSNLERSKAIQGDNVAGTVEERLAYMIRKAPGVMVNQNGSDYYVKVMGAGDSFVGNTGPLYVINGITYGHDFNAAAGGIAGSNIKSVRVLKGKDASFYGMRGSGGVIEIKTVLLEEPVNK